MTEKTQIFAQTYTGIGAFFASTSLEGAKDFIEEQSTNLPFLVHVKSRSPRMRQEEQPMLQQVDELYLIANVDVNNTEAQRVAAELNLLVIAQDLLSYFTKLNAEVQEDFYYFDIPRTQFFFTTLTPQYIALRVSVFYAQPFSLFFDQTKYA